MLTLSHRIRIVLLSAVLATAGSAFAREPRGGHFAPDGGAARGAFSVPGGPGGGNTSPGLPDRRQQWQDERGAAGADAPQRMTREERRELRREIHNAGREFYPRRPHR